MYANVLIYEPNETWWFSGKICRCVRAERSSFLSKMLSKLMTEILNVLKRFVLITTKSCKKESVNEWKKLTECFQSCERFTFCIWIVNNRCRINMSKNKSVVCLEMIMHTCIYILHLNWNLNKALWKQKGRVVSKSNYSSAIHSIYLSTSWHSTLNSSTLCSCFCCISRILKRTGSLISVHWLLSRFREHWQNGESKVLGETSGILRNSYQGWF